MDGKVNKSSEETLSLLHNITKSTLHGQILSFFLTALSSEKICKLPICKSLASPVMELTISLAKVCAVPWCSLLFLIVLYVTVRHNFALHFTLQHLYIYRSRAKARGNDFCSSVGRAHVFWRTRDRAFNFHLEEALKFSFFVPVCVSKCIYFWHSHLPHLTLQYLLCQLIRCKP